MGTHAPAEVRRAQILEAALQCFGRKGLEATRIDDIVATAGLSKGAIYFHFDSKDAIFEGLFESFEQAIFGEWERLEESDEALEALRQAGASALHTLLGMRPLLQAWVEFIRQPTSRARMADMYALSRERLAAMVRTGVASGQLRACDPTHVGATLTALVEGLLLQAFVDETYDPLEAWPTAWNAVVHGLAIEDRSASA